MARRFDHLPDVEAFLVVVEQGSFSAAAVTLSTTPSVLSRALTRLETRLGCQLLRRTTRRLRVTDAGQQYLEQARVAFGLISDAERDIQGREGVTGWPGSAQRPDHLRPLQVTSAVAVLLRKSSGSTGGIEHCESQCRPQRRRIRPGHSSRHTPGQWPGWPQA